MVQVLRWGDGERKTGLLAVTPASLEDSSLRGPQMTSSEVLFTQRFIRTF